MSARATIREVRPLPLPDSASTVVVNATTNQIAIGQTFVVPPAKADGEPKFKPFVMAARVAPFATAAGGLAFTADKVAAMPLPQLAHQLQQTPSFQLTDQSANVVAEHLKTIAASTLGRYVVVGVASGTLAVGVAYAMRPQMSARSLGLVFAIVAVAVVAVIYILSHYGVVVPAGASKP